MRHGNFDVEEKPDVNWRVVNALWPYLMQFKGRLIIAMVFLVLSKLAILVIPFFLKAIVDALDTPDKQTIVATMLLGVVLAYGAARFSNVLFGEIRDTIFEPFVTTKRRASFASEPNVTNTSTTCRRSICSPAPPTRAR